MGYLLVITKINRNLLKQGVDKTIIKTFFGGETRLYKMIELPVIRKGLKIGEIDLELRLVTVNKEAPVYFSCTSNIDCCSTMRIPASDFDIDQILAQGYELDQIIKEASPVILNPNSNLGRQQKAYILKTKPFDGTCTFLEDKLCSIHTFKPFACRIYPFALEFLDDTHIKLVIHQEQLCHSIRAVDPGQANNQELLENILQVMLEEITRRGLEI